MKSKTARKVSCLKKTHKNWSGLVVRTAIVKFSEKKLFLNFQENIRGGDNSDSGVPLAVWKVAEE